MNIKGKISKLFGILLVGVMLTIINPISALAATTADVDIDATPTYIAMTNTPAVWHLGIIAASTNYSTANNYFTANNTGSVPSDISLLVTTANWTGGVGWIHSNTAAPGVDTVGLTAYTAGGNVTIKTTAMDLKTDLAAATTETWGMMLISPTSFSDGELKTVKVRLTIVIHP